ncbi:MAG: peptidoglycan editing factor PgeF [Lachnospiraceae bacterium]
MESERIRIRRKEAGAGEHLTLSVHQNPDGSELPLLSFPALAGKGVVHGFSTRLGGVSEGPFASLNLTFSRGDARERVLENYRRLALALGTSPDRFVLTRQVHGTNVIHVTGEDAGKGVTRERDWDGVDGLVTDTPGIVLSVFSADCVPILFLDQKCHAIGACHSGWRGTVDRIGARVVETMQKDFGTDPKDLVCCIGPSICRDCYEIGDDVAERFLEAFPGQESRILENKHNGHWQLDLWAACRIVLLEAGVPDAQIHTTDVCTCCNPEILFSHRAASGGTHGNIGGFIMLQEKESGIG